MASERWDIRNWTSGQLSPSVQVQRPRPIRFRATSMFLATFRPKSVLALAASACLATPLLANGLQADPSLALEDFNGFCLPLLKTQTTPEYDGVLRIDHGITQQFIKANNASEDTVLWETRSSEFAIQTYESVHDFCFLFSFNSNLTALKEAYPAWRQSLDGTFLGPTELEESPGSAHRAGAFLVLKLEDGGVLQLALNHDAKILKGFTTLAAIRLESPSPAAMALLGKNAAQQTE